MVHGRNEARTLPSLAEETYPNFERSDVILLRGVEAVVAAGQAVLSGED